MIQIVDAFTVKHNGLERYHSRNRIRNFLRQNVENLLIATTELPFYVLMETSFPSHQLCHAQ